jgi:hypothetical protein
MGLFDFFGKKPAQPQTGAQSAAGPVKEIRSFVGTTGFLIEPGDPVTSQLGKQLFQFGVDQLKQKEPEFLKLYNASQNAPHKQGFGMAAKSEDLSMAYYDWMKKQGLGIGIPEKTFFAQGGDGQEPKSGAKFSFLVCVTFLT